MSTSFSIPFPPSVNSIWRNVGGRTLLSADGRRYRKAVVDAAIEQRAIGLGDLSARLVMAAWVPDNRRRDLDNLLKAALDAIVKAGLLVDDSQVVDLRIYRAGVDRANPRITVWMEPS